ncbi:ArsR/SmtB family transcription factor [Microbacterium stercoris]|uniref:Helix-turn-helix transcriptional regulator n=1 Tax=Microbacterium stercoris TaxID=2820289 RepID=A0A939QTA4_9MICO|nr:metalloregulator ArsR/SmtB family transcription factor [Microbacterium stercoris]MBO3664778.1 helix-turn-helix transcriptional regulator [Microbacterium stercoris]
MASIALEELGRVLAEPVRLRVLVELLGGPPLPAGALAARVGVAPSTVSAHLARLEQAGLIVLERQGRARLARLADPAVADAVESLLRLSGESAVTSWSAHDRRAALRAARSCYDHLAGRAGVGVADALVARGWIDERNGVWSVADDAPLALSEGLGIDVRLAPSRRPVLRPCADWTERRPHVAGRLGEAILSGMLAADWVRRRRDDRALTITPLGREGFEQLGIDGL